MFCPTCGFDCKDENFCPKCGRDVRPLVETVRPNSNTASAVPASPTSARTPSNCEASNHLLTKAYGEPKFRNAVIFYTIFAALFTIAVFGFLAKTRLFSGVLSALNSPLSGSKVWLIIFAISNIVTAIALISVWSGTKNDSRPNDGAVKMLAAVSIVNLVSGLIPAIKLISTLFKLLDWAGDEAAMVIGFTVFIVFVIAAYIIGTDLDTFSRAYATSKGLAPALLRFSTSQRRIHKRLLTLNTILYFLGALASVIILFKVKNSFFFATSFLAYCISQIIFARFDSDFI